MMVLQWYRVEHVVRYNNTWWIMMVLQWYRVEHVVRYNNTWWIMMVLQWYRVEHVVRYNNTWWIMMVLQWYRVEHVKWYNDAERTWHEKNRRRLILTDTVTSSLRWCQCSWMRWEVVPTWRGRNGSDRRDAAYGRLAWYWDASLPGIRARWCHRGSCKKRGTARTAQLTDSWIPSLNRKTKFK